MRVNLSLLAIILVDCWKVWSRITTKEDGEPTENQKQFYSRMATELIDNSYDRVAEARRRSGNGSPTEVDLLDPTTNLPRSGLDIHLTPTKRKRKNLEGEFTNRSFQGRCMECKQKTRFQCSRCKDDSIEKDRGWLCSTWKGKMCFVEHLEKHHKE